MADAGDGIMKAQRRATDIDCEVEKFDLGETSAARGNEQGYQECAQEEGMADAGDGITNAQRRATNMDCEVKKFDLGEASTT